MKKWQITVITALFLTILLTGCQEKADNNHHQNPPASAGASNSAGQSAPAKALEIAVELPEGWKRVEGSVLEHQYMKNTASFMVKAEPFTSDTLEGVVEEALAIYKNSFDNLALQGESEAITVDGREAQKLTFTCKVSQMEMKYTYVYLGAEGKTYVLTFGDLADSFDSLSADYETILNHIRFKQG